MSDRPTETLRETRAAITLMRELGYPAQAGQAEAEVDVLEQQLAEAQKQLDCDCVPMEISSVSCRKCGRYATVSHEQFVEFLKRANDDAAARVRAEKALAEAQAVVGRYLVATGRAPNNRDEDEIQSAAEALVALVQLGETDAHTEETT